MPELTWTYSLSSLRSRLPLPNINWPEPTASPPRDPASPFQTSTDLNLQPLLPEIPPPPSKHQLTWTYSLSSPRSRLPLPNINWPEPTASPPRDPASPFQTSTDLNLQPLLPEIPPPPSKHQLTWTYSLSSPRSRLPLPNINWPEPTASPPRDPASPFQTSTDLNLQPIHCDIPPSTKTTITATTFDASHVFCCFCWRPTTTKKGDNWCIKTRGWRFCTLSIFFVTI